MIEFDTTQEIVWKHPWPDGFHARSQMRYSEWFAKASLWVQAEEGWFSERPPKRWYRKDWRKGIRQYMCDYGALRLLNERDAVRRMVNEIEEEILHTELAVEFVNAQIKAHTTTNKRR